MRFLFVLFTSRSFVQYRDGLSHSPRLMYKSML
jgi:hypothetical protein